MPATIIAVNLDAWNVPKMLAAGGKLPSYVTDLAVSTVPGGALAPEDSIKLASQRTALEARGIKAGRYLNLGRGILQLDIQKVPTGGLDANLLTEDMFWGPPETLREYPNLPGVKCVVRNYKLTPSPARATLVRTLLDTLNATRDDLYFDGLEVPELVDSAAPHRLTDVVGYLNAIKSGIGARRRRSYNFSGTLADWTPGMVELVAGTQPYCITFESVLHPSFYTMEKMMSAIENIQRFKRLKVLPVLIGTSGPRERAFCEWAADILDVGLSL